MSRTTKTAGPSSRRAGSAANNRIFGSISPENLLFIATVLLFGYCFFYVSLPSMLRKHAATLSAATLKNAQPVSEHLAQAKQDNKQQRRERQLP